MICKNCAQHFEGNYCNHCGQHSQVGRIDFKFLLTEIPHSIFQLNRGFFFTVKALFVKPGHSIREYIAGKRQPYYKPLAFFLVTSALYVLSAYLLDRNTFTGDLVAGFTNGIVNNVKSSTMEILDWILRHQTFLTLAFIPLFSLASYLAFIKSKYNYVERFVLNLYISR